MLFVLCFVVGCEIRYNIEMASSPDDIDSEADVIEIPGDEEHRLICTLAGALRRPKKKTVDPVEYLSVYDGECMKTCMDEDCLHFCFDGESKWNQISLGFIEDFTQKNQTLVSFTNGGEVCPSGGSWSLIMRYECDNSAPREGMWIPRFWRSACSVFAILKTPHLCRHPDFSAENVLDVKCIPRTLAKRGRLRHLY